ncbi:hypothetical protein MGH68_05035 [Erysipelothrix sp. D19-032]
MITRFGQRYRENGVAIVHVPVDVGYTEIDDNYISSANAFEKAYPQHRAVDIDKAIHLIQEAKRPVIFAGRGTHHAQDELRELSEKFAMPVVLTFLGKGAMPDAHPNMMGQLGRLGSKSSNEAIQDTDLIVMVGAEYPFGREMFPQDIQSIQINIDPKTIGKRLPATVGILGDSKAVMREIIEKGQAIAPTQWLKANQINRKNWLDWIHHFEDDLSVPMRPNPL